MMTTTMFFVLQTSLLVADALVAAADGSGVISVRSRESDWRAKPPDRRVIIAAVAAAVLVVVGVVAFLYYIASRVSPPDQPLPSSSAEPAGPPVEIDRFPISTVGTSRPEFSQCAICLEELEEGEAFRTFPCRHVIHDACLTRGLSVPGTFRLCPHCRAELV